ncbi:MAG: hypothetical protein CMP23_00135 [Rickettsiales bacterium]|nr:hypothetical protein [Rickettsiales bacterium]
MIRTAPSLLIVVTLLLAVCPEASAQQETGGDRFDCSALYDGGDYPGAAACFSNQEARGNHNGHLLYNLGNALQQAGDLGPAILAYRRGQLFLPRDGDLKANLKSAREKARDDLAPPGKRHPLAATLLAPYDSLSAAELLLTGTFCWGLLFGLLSWRAWRNEALLTLPVAALTALALLTLGGHLARSYQVKVLPEAVVLAEQVTLRSGRDLRSVELARLHEGAELSVLSQQAEWTQVRLSTGQRGWLPRTSLGLIRFTPEQNHDAAAATTPGLL